jgi:hypothetical protein
MPEPEGLGPLFAASLLLGVLLVVATLTRRWLGRREARAGALTAKARSFSTDAQEDPGRELLALADSLRDALVQRFGESWRAKTTEEVGASSTLVEFLGQERLGVLVEFLETVDRVKFAEAAAPSNPEVWREPARALAERLAAGARSTTIGK